MKKKIDKINLILIISIILVPIAFIIWAFASGFLGFSRSERAYSPTWEPPIQLREATPESIARNEVILERIDNDSQLEEIIRKRSNISEIPSFPGNIGMIFARDEDEYMRRAELYEIDEWYNIEALRRMNNGDVYAVFEVEGWGRHFFFFQQGTGYQLTHRLRMDQLAVESDFDVINIGDNIHDHDELLRTLGQNFLTASNQSYRFFLLENTLIIIHMEFDSELRSYVVTEIESRPSKRIYVSAGDILGGRILEEDEVFDFNILPQDFPHQ